MPKQVEKVVNAFRAVVQNSVPVGASVLNSHGPNINIVTSWSQRNIERKLNMTSDMFQTINFTTQDVLTVGCSETTGLLLSSYSPSSSLRGVLRETAASGKTSKKQYIEVWKNNVMCKQFDLQQFDLHGDVYTDTEFGCFEWSQCEEQLLYVAEKKLPKTESFLSHKTKSDEGEKVVKGNEYLLVEEWGEQLVGKSWPVVAVADLTREEIRLIDLKGDDNLVLGSAVWAPGGSSGGIVAVAYSIEPFRLGKIFCTNRLSWVVHVSPDGNIQKLSDDGCSVLGPHFSPDQSKLVWLEREVGGPHHSCMRLVKFDWTTKKKSVIIDYVDFSMKCVGGQTFYGIFNYKLSNCWLSDNRTVILSTPQRCSVKTYAIDTDECTITQIGGSEKDDYSQGVLQVQGNYVICWQSSLLDVPGVVIAELDSNNVENVKWFTLVEKKSIQEDYMCTTIDLEAPMDTEGSPPSVNKYSTIYFGPKRGENVPLIIWSHGGPNSVFPNAYNMEAYFFAKLGFAMTMVNYRGSIGAGKASIDHLLGKVGSSDVCDVHRAGQQVASTFPLIDLNKCILYGGSHGGFLTLHLAGQFPSCYKAASSSNPVTDISALMTSSDIPDCLHMFRSFAQAGEKYSPLDFPKGDTMEKMFKVSPINYVKEVEAPVLLLLGKKDLRVPCHQGLNYYHALKAHGKAKAKVLIYDDCHSLSQSANETDFLINTALWFMEHVDHTVD